MAEHMAAGQGLVRHGGTELPAVTVDAYNAELRDADGFLGDRASKRAFQSILEDWRERLRKLGEDPLGDRPTGEFGPKRLDRTMNEGDPEAAAVIHAAIEEFAQELATVTRRLLRLKSWRGTERIAVGGGFRQSRVGEVAIGRAGLLLKADGIDLTYQPIRHHPDEAGLVGAVHLAPSWMFSGHDSILAVDVGGTNIRAGVVELNLKKARDLSATHVMGFDLWRHRDDDPSREEAIDRLADMLRGLIRRAEKDRRSLAPFIGIGCPGLIREDGKIERGGQNLPGNWESSRFNLPARIREAIPEIGGHETVVVLHNDAVVQGLSEIPCMSDVTHWGVLTIGTGLGNARFTNRAKPAPG
jgi:predicted NBD/HSP70 family sugar kinase